MEGSKGTVFEYVKGSYKEEENTVISIVMVARERGSGSGSIGSAAEIIQIRH